MSGSQFFHYRRGIETGAMTTATPNAMRECLDEIDRLDAERTRLEAERARLQNAVGHQRRELATQRNHLELGLATAHLLIEAGVVPGVSVPCRCEKCKLVAESMDDAGYMDDVRDRWWET